LGKNGKWVAGSVVGPAAAGGLGGPRTWAIQGAASIVGLLVLLAALGVFLNLWVVLPTTPGFPSVFGIVLRTPALLLHAAIRLLLVANSSVVSVFAGRTGERRLFGVALAGLVSVIIAGQQGFGFVAPSDHVSSFGTEMGFLGAIASGAALLYLSSRIPEAPKSLDPVGSAGTGA
jgi:hypothetical protein